MKFKARYSIGEVSRICGISKKTLRYYDEIGLITTQRKDYNNYRYYTADSLLAVPIIKYYKQMGFKLDEMQRFIEGDIANVYRSIQNSFLTKIEELEAEREEIHRKYISVKDWYDLILEAEMVIENEINEVSIKYIEPAELLFLNQSFDSDIKAAIINIDFTNYVAEIENKITGPVILNFSSFKDRMNDAPQAIKVLQKNLIAPPKDATVKFGGHMMVTCYHIGPHETIKETYEKIGKWANNHGYILGEESFERYVTDYWTTRNNALFVTEVMLAASRKKLSDAQ